ncbi:MAG TPA: DUF4349 domain-containing protein [Ktedonobacterales bacterium]|nr:DUF4349 domain-containing protein [Ktedonobacterales bacterium]
MWNHMRRGRGWSIAGLIGLVGLVVLLAGCGGAASYGASGAATSQDSSHAPSRGSTGSAGAAGSPSSGSTGTSTQPPSPQYLIKSLGVNMTAPDPRKAASDLQAWILATDPKAQSAGLSYAQDGASFDISMTFNVEASLYPQVESYLAGYAQGHGGKLLNLRESVQDVTNDFVDSQSRLTNLRAEQQRLLSLMNRAQSLADVLTIEQRLTDVEGQIEDIQTHLALLSGQTAYYTVQIEVSPLDSTTVAPPEAWNPGQIFHQALGAALVFGQGLLTLLIWLGVFALYIVPAIALIWFGRRLVVRRRATRLSAPPTSPAR